MDDSLRTPLMNARCRLMTELIYDIHCPNEPTRIFKRCVPSPAMLKEKHPGKTELSKMKIGQVDLAGDERTIGIVVTDNKGFCGNSAKTLAALLWSAGIFDGYGSLMGLLVQDIDPAKLASVNDMRRRLADAKMEVVYDTQGFLTGQRVDKTGGLVSYDGHQFRFESDCEIEPTPSMLSMTRNATLSGCRGALYRIKASASNLEEVDDIADILSFGKWHIEKPKAVEERNDNPYSVLSNGVTKNSNVFADHAAVERFNAICNAWIAAFEQMGCSFDYGKAMAAGHIQELGRFFGADVLVSALVDDGVSPEWVLGDYDVRGNERPWLFRHL